MIKREILSDLELWKAKKDHKPLILRGARQVGKTTVVVEFSRRFDTFLSLNLEKRQDANLFENNDDPKLILDEIYLYLNQLKKRGDTLLFIDEIQNSPKAIALLRYFHEEIPELYIIAAGSLLESIIDIHVSFPVGRVEYMALRPCSFLEFLNGIGKEFDADIIRSGKVNSIHDRLMADYRKYILVGGMPEAINTYAENSDLLACEPIYESLIASYIDDSEKYSKNDTQRRVISHILTSGWAEAAETIVFENFAGSNFKSREVAEAFRILERTMLLELVYPIVEPRIPLLQNLRRRPKLLWIDTGLVNYQAGMRSDLFAISDVMDMWRGRVGEQIVGQELIAYNHRILQHRYFWSKDSRDGCAEVDFLIQHRNMIVPIEVKTGHNSKLKSLHSFMEVAGGNIAVRIWNQPYSVNDVSTPSGKNFKLINLPFYYISQLTRILDENM